MDEPQPAVTRTPTADEAVANAVRILNNAETETDRQLMERLTHIADTWISVAGLQFARHEER